MGAENIKVRGNHTQRQGGVTEGLLGTVALDGQITACVGGGPAGRPKEARLQTSLLSSSELGSSKHYKQGLQQPEQATDFILGQHSALVSLLSEHPWPRVCSLGHGPTAGLPPREFGRGVPAHRQCKGH